MQLRQKCLEVAGRSGQKLGVGSSDPLCSFCEGISTVHRCDCDRLSKAHTAVLLDTATVWLVRYNIGPQHFYLRDISDIFQLIVNHKPCNS